MEDKVPSFFVWQMLNGGTVQPIAILANTMNDATGSLPEGVYTTLRTYQSIKILHLGAHLNRLEESARLLGCQIVIDKPLITHILRVAINQTPDFIEKRLRIQIDTTQQVGDVYVLVEELHTPTPDEYLKGVSAVTHLMHRENARAKSTSFIPVANKIRENDPTENNEILMVGEGGELLEGLSSNFFAILNEEICTAEEGVLHGITRESVLDACLQHKINVVKKAVLYTDLNHITEAFITSASRGVLALVSIDGISIGNGIPGATTQIVSKVYETYIFGQLEDV